MPGGARHVVDPRPPQHHLGFGAGGLSYRDAPDCPAPGLACCGDPEQLCRLRPVTTFSTVSRANLRRAGPDGLDVNRARRARPIGGVMSGPVARRTRPGQSGGAPLAGGSFRRALRAEALPRAELPRPVASVTDRVQCPPYLPDAAPGREDQAVSLTRIAPTPGRSQAPGRNAAHCPGRPVQPQRCFASRCAGHAFGVPLTPETSANPAGLTARARPKARPEAHAANLIKVRACLTAAATDQWSMPWCAARTCAYCRPQR
jgi:hypothetical protein